MAEWHADLRRRSHWLAFLALACAIGLAAGFAMAAAPTQSRAAAAKRPLPIPGAFRLPASNGYTLDVVGIPPYDNRPAVLLIYASAKDKSVVYQAPATVTETSMQADLGALGEISVTFHRSGRAATAPCEERTIRFDSGSYEGTVAFHGEEGFTSVEATSIPGSIDYWLAPVCSEGSFFTEGFSRRPRGAALHVRNPALGAEMSVRKPRPGAAAEIAAWALEYSSGISIRRFASVRMPGEGFSFDRRLRIASVRPPAPFAGSAQFDRRKKAGKRWSGDLTVDLPGKSDVPLTGTLLRAFLVPSE